MKSSFLLLLLLIVYTVEGGIFIKVNPPYIHQDAVWLYSNSTAITSIAPDVPANEFSKSVIPLANLPLAHKDGSTIGVLYHRENACLPISPNTTTPPLPFYEQDAWSTKVPKIALIQKQVGSCSLFEKIFYAQLEGAIGVVLYDTVFINYSENQTLSEDRNKGVPVENNLKIPAYHVDHSVGQELYFQLEKMAGVPDAPIPMTNLTTRIAVRVQLFPVDHLQPTAWELTLLVMIVILGTSVLFSVAMHIYMWKKGKKLQQAVERNRHSPAPANNALLPMGKPLLSVARLYEFPTRTIDTLPDEEERKKVENVLSDEKQVEALINTTALLSPGDHRNNTTRSDKLKKMFLKKKSLPSSTSPSTMIKMTTHVNNMCVVCLEAFKIGDEVRELPCRHEYHCICIDPWLTSKSGECPLCKFDCSADKSEEEMPLNTTNRGLLRRLFEKITMKSKRNSILPTAGVDVRRSVHLQQENIVPPALEEITISSDTTEDRREGEEEGEITITFPGGDVRETALSQHSQSEEDAQPRPSITSTISDFSPPHDQDLLSNMNIASLPFLDLDLSSLLDERPNHNA